VILRRSFEVPGSSCTFGHKDYLIVDGLDGIRACTRACTAFSLQVTKGLRSFLFSLL